MHQSRFDEESRPAWDAGTEIGVAGALLPVVGSRLRFLVVSLLVALFMSTWAARAVADQSAASSLSVKPYRCFSMEVAHKAERTYFGGLIR